MSLALGSEDFDKVAVQDLPKTDLHVHAESSGRLLQVIARRRGWKRSTHRDIIDRKMREFEPGLSRLLAINEELVQRRNEKTGLSLAELCEQPDYVEALFESLMEEEAADGSILAEIRVGGGWPLFPHFLSCFRAAERRVRSRHPRFHAEPIIAWGLSRDAALVETVARYTLARAEEGIAGVDLYPEYRFWDHSILLDLAQRATNAGLGVTCHDGEFGSESLWRAIDLPGLTRIGHGTQACSDPRLLEEFAKRGIVVEVSLTSNVITGAVASYGEHPIRRFIEAGVKVTLCSDDPLMFETTIGNEYAIASEMGFSKQELLEFTRSGIEASFTSTERQARLLGYLS
jgi:adenosine deaminase